MVDLPALFKELAIDLVPSPFGAAIKEYMRQRAEEASRILIEEVRKARIDAAQAASRDDAVASIFRFERAVLEGTARLNLRLMAKAMAGRLQIGTLVADEFLLYADAVAALSRDEIIFIAELFKAHLAREANPALPPAYENVAASPWTDAKLALTQAGWTEDQVTTAATRAQRSGLVAAGSAWGGLVFKVTGMLLDVAATVDFEDALRAEGVRP
jgi:hypothetical protein